MKKPVVALIITLFVVPVLYLLLSGLSSSANYLKILRPVSISENNEEGDNQAHIEDQEIFIPRLNINEIIEDLELINETSPSAPNFRPRYYSTGKVTRGPYENYQIIIMIKNYPLISDPLIVTFVTFDNKRYFTQDKLDKENLNTKKVTLVNDLELSHPAYIRLDDTFTLNRLNILTDYIFTGNRDSDDSMIYQTVISGDLSKAELLGRLGELEVYGYKSSSEILLADKNGITYSYYLGFTNLGNSPRTSFSTAELSLEPGVELYTKYGVVLPRDCSENNHTRIADKIEDKTRKLGTFGIYEIFAYENGEHPLYKESFEVKIVNQMFGNDLSFQTINQQPRPDFETYMKRYPVIFIRDYWDRVLAFGEEEFKLLNKCE